MKRVALILLAASFALGWSEASADPVSQRLPMTFKTTLAAGSSTFFKFRIFGSAVGGSELWAETTPTKLKVSANKTIRWTLGSVVPFTDGVAGPVDFSEQMWVQASSGAKTFPRVKLAVVPYALWSATSDHAGRVYVASFGAAGIGPNTEANAAQYAIISEQDSGKYLVRLDAELNTFGALYFIYNCKLQYKTYPALIGAPYVDLAGTRRSVSWRIGRELSGSGVPVSISAQAPVTAGSTGLDVRLVCWGEWDGGSPPVVDYGFGFNSGVLTLQAVSSVN